MSWFSNFSVSQLNRSMARVLSVMNLWDSRRVNFSHVDADMRVSSEKYMSSNRE